MAQVICPSFSGAAVLRATKLDGCCRPLFEDPQNPGGSGQVTTDAFVNIVVSPGEDEGGDQGDQNPITKADGQVCFTTLTCPTPSNYGVSLELCALDPSLVLIMKPNWCPIRDSTGMIIGFSAVSGGGCDSSGFALEVWMNVYSGAGAACKQSQGGAEYGYLLFPCISGVQIGQWTIANGPITFSFSGTTRRSSGWGRGPYNVLMDGQRPAPLACPVRANADFVQFVTTFPPPEPDCGIQPVDGGIPEPPEVLVKRGSNTTGCLVTVQADNRGYGPVRVRWGDGAETELRDGQIGQHSYGAGCGNPNAAPATYELTVCDKAFPQICTNRTLTVPLPPDEPVIRCLQDPTDDTGRSVLVDVTLPTQAWCGTPDPDTVACACPGESPIGKYGLRVDWGEDAGTDQYQYIAVGEDCTARLRHTFTTDGRFPIKVCRNDIPNFCGRCTYVAGGLRPDVTFVSWNQSCTATISVFNNDRGTVSVDWGDGSPLQTGVRPGTLTHAYPDGLGRSFLIMVCSEAVDGGCRSVQTPVCTGGGAELIAVAAVCDPTDGTGRRFKVTADNRGHGSVVISATSGATIDDATNQGDGVDVTTVLYPAGLDGRFVITATDPDEDGRTGADTVNVPCQSGPDATAICDPADDHKVTLDIAAGTRYPITVDWGDGDVQTYQSGQIPAHTYWKEGDPLQVARKADPILGGTVTLSQTTVHQQADVDRTNGDVYFSQVINGGRQLAGENAAIDHAVRAANGHLAINRVAPNGTEPISHMYLVGVLPGPSRGWDHGSGLGVQHSGSTVNLFTAIDPPPTAIGSNGYGTQVARFPYTAGKILQANDPSIERYDPRPDSDHVNPCLDLDHDRIAVRHRSQDNQYHITVWKLSDFLARQFGSPVFDCAVNDTSIPNFQCWTLYGNYAYHFYGAGDANNARLTVTDIRGATGNVITNIPNDQYPNLTWRESESIFVLPSPEGPRLAWGFSTDATGRRKANVYATPAHRASQPVQIIVKDADGGTAVATGVTQIPCTGTPAAKGVSIKYEGCPPDANKIKVSYVNANNRGVKIYWIPDDPNPTTHAAATGEVVSPREYQPGSYEVCVQDIQDSSIRACGGPYPVPCEDLGNDTYFNFEDLATDLVPGTGALVNVKDRDYFIIERPVANGLSHIAIHGGGMEAPPEQLADQAAQNGGYGFYTFSGRKPSNNASLHITSTRFDEPTGVAHVASAPRIVSWHGHADREPGTALTYVGGLDTELRDAIRAELTAAGFLCKDAPSGLTGTDRDNICNKCEFGAGCQIEISRTQRQAFYAGGDLSLASIQNPANRTAAFNQYITAVNKGVTAVLNPPET
jgi:phage replication-related protein YjqB (UPF0714/DUF867 family)